MLRERIEEIRSRLPDKVTLIAVSKTHSAAEINEAIDCGISDIGENKVQELLSKYDAVKPVRWHMIGHLQRNKVKQIVDKVYMIHSVDSLRVAEEIDRRCAAAGRTMNVLIQVNAAGETQKFGVAPDEVGLLAEEIGKLPNLRLRGLMNIAPASDDPEELRGCFREMKNIFDGLKQSFGADFDTLSMGMSSDFELAVEEGANCVRVGTAIFGERDYGKI